MNTAEASPRSYATLAFLMLLNVLNIIDRNLLGSFAPQVVEDLQLSDSQFGMLTGIIFVFFYAIAGLYMGTLADRVHRPRLIAVGLMLWSILTAYSGLAKNFLQIAIARLLIGVGESSLSPASLSLLADLFPQRRRGMAAGIYYLGIPLGAGASFIIAGLLGPTLGWRNCFLLLGGLGVLLTVPLLLMKEPRRGAMDIGVTNQPASIVPLENTTTKKNSPSEIVAALRDRPALLLTILGAIFLHIPVGAGQFALLWLVRERGFDSAQIATTYGMLFILFGTLGTVFGGMASDWYQARFNGGRIRFLALLMLTVAPFTIGYRLGDSGSTIFYMGMAAGFVFMSAFYGPAFSTAQDLSPIRMRGVISGLLLLSCNLIGIGLGAVMTGMISDALQGIGEQQPLTWALITADLVSLLAVPLFFLASRYIARMDPA